MEKPNFNNQSKAEIEKTPQENEDSLNDQEQESGKRENITLEIDGQKIEAVKYYFEYPERIQKETGILGYERIKISDQKLLKQIESALPQNKAGIIGDICESLSDGEYPNYTLNHIIGAYTTKNEHAEMYEDFKKDKFFIQKIFGLELIERKRNRNNINHREIFNHGPGGPSHYPRVNYSLIKKDSYDIIKNQEFIGKIADDKETITSENFFATTIHGEAGLNMIPGSWFGSYPGKDQVSFGFATFGTDSFFEEYAEKVFLEFIKIIDSNEGYEHIKNGYTFNTSAFLFLVTKYGKEFGFLKGDNKLYGAVIGRCKLILDKFLEKNNINNLPGETKSKILSSLVECGYRNFGITEIGLSAPEVFLPVMFDHHEIPQLSWGHAKYAHYFNDKSFNFFKFKHADHLPVKEKLNSFES